MAKDIERICEQIEAELKKVADRGLTSGNIDTAYKLIDMYKDIKTVEGMEDYAEDGYSQTGYSRNYGGNYSNGNSSSYAGGRHYVRGHYSRDNGGYSGNYSRNGYSNADGYKGKLVDTLENLMHDADSKEERDMIEKYMRKIDEM